MGGRQRREILPEGQMQAREGAPRTSEGEGGRDGGEPCHPGPRRSPISVFRHWPEAVSQIRLQSKTSCEEKEVTAGGLRVLNQTASEGTRFPALSRSLGP